MGKIVLGNLLRHLITLLIAYFVARHMLAEDVARKLYAGDTVELWGGAWSVNLKQITDFLTLSVVPVLIPVLLGIWSHIKERYKLIVARLSAIPMTNGEVKQIAAAAPSREILQTVLAKP